MSHEYPTFEEVVDVVDKINVELMDLHDLDGPHFPLVESCTKNNRRREQDEDNPSEAAQRREEGTHMCRYDREIRGSSDTRFH